jgi:cellulose synthase/poly-beta-1,6-N-acetylglucosamine synthase-like glycosyltransferase
MSTFFFILGGILLLQSIFALARVLRFANYCRRSRHSRSSRYQPKAVVIVPCRGLDHEFEDNIRAYLTQDYRDYEVIFVTENEADPAHATVSRIVKQSRRASWIVLSGEAKDSGQKVHNLIAAVEMLDSIDRRAEVLVFADSDALPSRTWLSELVAPLGDKRIGATTGFRWYLPTKPQISSLLLAVWNASALALLGERSGFAWGGSTAIRRENFEKLGIKSRWQGAVSDDYVLTAAVAEARQRIKFVPQCLVVSHIEASFQSLLEFTTRQIRITRVYAPTVWKLTAFSHVLYNLVFWGGLAWIIAGTALGHSTGIFVNMLAVIFLLGLISGIIRAVVAGFQLRAAGTPVAMHVAAYALLGPFVSLIFLYNLFASIWTTRIIWREIEYDLVSPTETTILDRPTAQNSRQSSPSAKTKPGSSVRSSSQKR